MTFETYAQLTAETAIYPNRGDNLSYPALGLCGEAGEVAEKVKKILRDRAGVITDEARESVAKELGDVLWYVSALCFEFNLSMDAVAAGNIGKLMSRKQRGTLGGSGDNR